MTWYYNNYLVFLEASIGGGKSTLLADLRAQRHSWRFHDEPVEFWRSYNGVNWLDMFYADQKEFSFMFQNVVFESYTRMNMTLAGGGCGVNVYERSPRSAFRVFSKMALASGTISPKQYECLELSFNHQFNALYNLNAPYHTVRTLYIRTDPVQAWVQALCRMRPEEHERLTFAYMTRLHEAHDVEYLGKRDTLLVDVSERVHTPTEVCALALAGIEGSLLSDGWPRQTVSEPSNTIYYSSVETSGREND
jgi:deoxyadenosine/deoxycytidine kinase